MGYANTTNTTNITNTTRTPAAATPPPTQPPIPSNAALLCFAVGAFWPEAGIISGAILDGTAGVRFAVAGAIVGYALLWLYRVYSA